MRCLTCLYYCMAGVLMTRSFFLLPSPPQCIGFKLALEEATLSLVQLLQRFTFEVDAAHHPVRQLELSVGITVSAKGGIWLKANPRDQQKA